MVLFFWKSKRWKLVGVFPFWLWWKVTEKFVNRAKKIWMIIQKFLSTIKFQETQIHPTHVCCLLIKETFLKILDPLHNFPLTFSWNSIYICSIMQLKRKKTEKNWQWTLLKVLVCKDSQFNKALLILIYMYGLRYLQFNWEALPHLYVSNLGAHAEGIR